jgi:hypothetical protein
MVLFCLKLKRFVYISQEVLIADLRKEIFLLHDRPLFDLEYIFTYSNPI